MKPSGSEVATYALLVLCGLVTVSDSAARNRDGEHASKLEQARLVIDEFAEIDANRDVLRQAVGLAVIPQVRGFSVFFGGRKGRGVLVRRLRDDGWSTPAFVSFGGASFGFRFDFFSSEDIVVALTNERELDALVAGNLWLPAMGGAAAAAGAYGGEAGKKGALLRDVSIHVVGRRGSSFGVDGETAVMSIDDDLTSEFSDEFRIQPLVPRTGTLPQSLRDFLLALDAAAAERNAAADCGGTRAAACGVRTDRS